MTDRAHDKDTVWTNASLPALAPLAADHTAAVCVVGAGIAGLSTAYMLAKEGRSVIVLDDGAVGGGETGLTTAHLVTALDRRWAELSKLHPTKNLRLAAESHASAIDTIERIAEAEAIDCDFRRVSGYLFAAPGHTTNELKAEIEAAHAAGLTDVLLVDRAPLVDFETGPAVRFPRQAQIHILRYLAGLARAVERAGGAIYTRAHVIEVDEESKPDHVIVKTDRGISVTANEVVLATNSPFLPRVSVHLKQSAYRTYAIALRVGKGSFFPALYWDTADPFHYVRLSNLDGFEGNGQYEYLIVGGEDHKTGQAADADQRHGRLEAWARDRFPSAGPVAHRWSGEVIETLDGLAYIGRIRKESRVMIVTGDCGDGITHGTIAGMLLTDLVHGRPNEWAELYDPSRVNLRSATDYLRENLNNAAQLTDWLTAGDIRDTDELAPGTGAIMRKGLSKLAVYKDPEGHVHAHSAVCPHLGCIVAWNAAEHTWDCPCHGSRFDRTGRCIHGPATADLKPVNDEDRPAEGDVRVDTALGQPT